MCVIAYTQFWPDQENAKDKNELARIDWIISGFSEAKITMITFLIDYLVFILEVLS